MNKLNYFKNWIKRNKTGAIVGGIAGFVSNQWFGFPRFYIPWMGRGCSGLNAFSIRCLINPFIHFVLPIIAAILLGAFIQSKLRGRK